MTPLKLRNIRRELRLSRGALSLIVRQSSDAIKHWETPEAQKGHRAIPGAAAVLFEELAAGRLPHLIAAGKA